MMIIIIIIIIIHFPCRTTMNNYLFPIRWHYRVRYVLYPMSYARIHHVQLPTWTPYCTRADLDMVGEEMRESREPTVVPASSLSSAGFNRGWSAGTWIVHVQNLKELWYVNDGSILITEVLQ